MGSFFIWSRKFTLHQYSYIMGRNILLLSCLAMLSFSIWQTDFEKAKKTAAEKHQLILLNFSGSDWCIPCIRMRKEIFDSPAFMAMADTALVLVNADFPRKKKNQPSPEQKKQNEALAEKYNPEGKFPYTVLLDATGKLIYQWDGLPNQNAATFAQKVKSFCDANH